MTLPDGTDIDLKQISRVRLAKKGAGLGIAEVSTSTGDAEPLTVPEDSLTIRLKNNSQVAVRGDAAQIVFDQLSRLQDEARLDFVMELRAAPED